MKFSNGYWQTRPGLAVLRNLPTATITLSSPMADIIRVRI
jgi:hypothetical protein